MSAAGYVKPPWAARVIGGRMAPLFKPADHPTFRIITKQT
jgi:hypothetical protein